jgi:putative ABC transport system permease protein
MRWIESVTSLFGQTAANVWRNKLRSFLTMFGIAWGIVSLVLMSALCDGFRQGQRKNMAQIGDNLVFLFGGRTQLHAGGQRAGRRVFLNDRDVRALREQCPLLETVSGELRTGEVSTTSAFNSGRFNLVGVSPEYLKLRNLPVETGRQVQSGDVEEGRRVCVLGASVKKQLFEERRALGERVSIAGYPYTVIGLMGKKSQNSSYDGWDNEKVLVPVSSLRRDQPPYAEAVSEDRLDAILYRPVLVRDWKAARAQAQKVLGRLHDFDPHDEGALGVWDMIEGAELFDKVFDATEIFLAVVALVTLTLGGVGVMNTMMMAVAERTHEIGVKKALGATKARIMLDFFLEGLLLALLSGVAGTAVVWALSSVVNGLPMPEMFSGLPIEWDTALIAIAALGSVAVLAALPPAWRAAQLTPVEALRFER